MRLNMCHKILFHTNHLVSFIKFHTLKRALNDPLNFGRTAVVSLYKRIYKSLRSRENMKNISQSLAGILDLGSQSYKIFFTWPI